MSLLILSSEKDLAADFLIVELIRRELPYFRLNTEDLATANYTLHLDGADTIREVSVGPKSVDLGTVEAIWYRRAMQPSVVTVLTPGERSFIAGELRHLATGLILNPSVRWVNPIDHVSVAEHKLYQLRVAQEIGFRIPKTLVSNNPLRLREFVGGNPGATICKPIFHGLLVDGSQRYSIYTRGISAEMIDDESVGLCPAFLQEQIPKKSDVRATFIGPKCFVAEVTSSASFVDWRDPEAGATFSISQLDLKHEAMCQQMLSRLGLVYGAFDFVMTPDGELVFLEVNPTGEWAWLESKLGFPMRDAFIQLFFGR